MKLEISLNEEKDGIELRGTAIKKILKNPMSMLCLMASNLTWLADGTTGKSIGIVIKKTQFKEVADIFVGNGKILSEDKFVDFMEKSYNELLKHPSDISLVFGE